MKIALCMLGAVAGIGMAGSAGAVGIVLGDATNDLGPDFFIDEAASGGGDKTTNEPATDVFRKNFAAINPLNVGTGGSLITITGMAWACPNAAAVIDATTMAVTIRYLGADGMGGNGDDVIIGTATDSFTFSAAGEYVWKFDTPMSQVIDGANSFFRFELTPTNGTGDGSMRYKTISTVDLTPKFSAAGTSVAVSANDPADLDNDGDVDDADFGIAFAAFTGPNNGPSSNPAADLDGDNDVDDADFGLAFAAFTGPGGGAAVPEPTSLALLGLGGLMIARRRRA